MEAIILVAKTYFLTGLVISILSIFAFFYKYSTENIDKFISSVQKDSEARAAQIQGKIAGLRDMGVPEGVLNTLPYLGILLHSFQVIFIWPWHLYNVFQNAN